MRIKKIDMSLTESNRLFLYIFQVVFIVFMIFIYLQLRGRKVLGLVGNISLDKKYDSTRNKQEQLYYLRGYSRKHKKVIFIDL